MPKLLNYQFFIMFKYFSSADSIVNTAKIAFIVDIAITKIIGFNTTFLFYNQIYYYDKRRSNEPTILINLTIKQIVNIALL
jgi:hypothetical protein